MKEALSLRDSSLHPPPLHLQVNTYARLLHPNTTGSTESRAAYASENGSQRSTEISSQIRSFLLRQQKSALRMRVDSETRMSISFAREREREGEGSLEGFEREEG